MTLFAATISPSSVSFTGASGKNYVISLSHPNNEIIRTKLKEYNSAPDKAALVAELETLADIPSFIDQRSEGKITVKNGVVYYGDESLHNSLTTRILWGLGEGFDMKPYVALLENIMLNPSRQAVNELYDFLEAAKMGITDDGHFLAYKRVRSDYTDIRTGKISNAIGQRPSMPRNKVDDNRGNLCSAGLHFCSISYLPHFSSSPDNRVVILKINPKHVVSIPLDYNHAKGRAEEYLVVGEYPLEDLKDILSSKPVWTESDLGQFDPDYDDEDEVYDDEDNGCCEPIGENIPDIKTDHDGYDLHIRFSHSDFNYTLLVNDNDEARAFVYSDRAETPVEKFATSSTSNEVLPFIHSIRYDYTTKEMVVIFKNKVTYAYSGVPLTVYEEFLNSPHRGTYFNEKVRDIYEYRRLSE